jgi:hypothetical protein
MFDNVQTLSVDTDMVITGLAPSIVLGSGASLPRGP